MMPAMLVGREEQQELLHGLVDAVAAGRGSAGLLEGEPGIGKTALLTAGLAGASERGCTVAWAVGDELSRRFPLRVVLDALDIESRSADPRRAQIAAVLRGESVHMNNGDPVAAASERLLALVERLCGVSPVVLVVDDLHWADDESLTLWLRLARLTNQAPLLLAAACRPVPRRDEVDRVRREIVALGGVVLPVNPLQPA